MNTWLDFFHDDQARASARTPTTAGQLFASPIARPTLDQCELVDRCISASRRAGLFIPASLEISWHAPEPGIAPAGVRFDNGRLRLALSVFQSSWDLRLVSFHELKHVHDFAVGRHLDRAAWEVDAERFARSMVERDC